MSSSSPTTGRPAGRLRRLGIVSAALGIVGGTLTMASSAMADASVVNDFEAYADTAAATTAGWFNFGNAGFGIAEVPAGDPLAQPDQTCTTKVLSIGWNVTVDPFFGGNGFSFADPANWSSFDGIRFAFKGSDNGGTLEFEISEGPIASTPDGDQPERYRSSTTISDDTSGWTLVELPFSTFAPAGGYNPNPGNSTLDLTEVVAFTFAAASGVDNGGAKIDGIELYNTGDPVTPVCPSTPTTTAAPSTTAAPTTAAPTTAAPTTAAPTTAAPTTTAPVTKSIESFESYPAADGVPSSWFNYGNAGGGVSLVGPSDARARSGQTADNKILAWGFDVDKDPQYGGVGKEYSTPQNWTGYTGIQFWFYGSGEGGELQFEIGEDKTSEVERYRAPAFIDNQVGWRLIKLPFSSFAPGTFNPNPGNGKLDLVSVENFVFAANVGSTEAGVAIDDIALYISSDLPASGSSSTTPLSTAAVLMVLAGLGMVAVGQTRRRRTA